MTLKTLSIYRLRAKSSDTGKSITTTSGRVFLIMSSAVEDDIRSYYVVDSDWNDGTRSTVTPLAYILAGRSSGKVKVASFHPDHFGLGAESDEIMSQIVSQVKALVK